MIRFLCAKIKNALVTLRFSILSIFVSLFVLSISLLTAINYMHSTQSLIFTANQMMQNASSTLVDQFSREIAKAEHDDTFTSRLIEQDILDPSDIPQMTKYTFDLANQFSIVESAYWGGEDGNVINARYEDDDSIATEIIDRTKKKYIKYYLYRDVDGKVLRKVDSDDQSYDPRTRPWYIAAKNAKKTIWTDFYQYQEHRFLGITVATPIYKSTGEFRGVFALDIRLDWLSWYVREQNIGPHAAIFIITQDGKLIAFPKLYEQQEFSVLEDIHSLSLPWIVHAYDLYKKNNKTDFIFSSQGKSYLANFKVVPQFAMHGWLIGVVAPIDDFTENLKILNLIDVAIGLTILIIAIVIVSMLVTRVVRPIKELAKQTEKIKKFELDDETRINTRIKEVAKLSDAIHSMRKGLQSFQKYIPAGLVRQLIKTGENAVIGGTKKPLTIFFSDIENFTNIAERMEPNELMEHMCEYFNEMSKILSVEKATIDKYIGDAIMAFWGAPLKIDHMCERAARSALNCLNRLKELNANWEKTGKIPFFTRVGIHTGDAIVGNLGSDERINYTALGDVTNVASRLEGINKIYHTHIMVSDSVYDIIKDQFVLRKVDEIILKGKIHSIYIYELLAYKKNELPFDVDAYQASFDRGFAAYQQQQWDAAVKLFNECLTVYPQDTVAPVFIKRCHEFKISPPPKNWDGVWRVTDR